MMEVFVAVLCLLSTLHIFAESQDVLPNIGYLLRGYHLFEGNPLATQVTADPGFVSMIFEPNYTQNKMSSDNKYLIPDGTKSYPKEGCTQAFNHEILQDSDEYQRLLKDIVKTNYTGFDHSFKGSSDFQDTHRAHSKDGSTNLLLTQVVCLKYEAYLDLAKPPLYNMHFIDSLREILAADQRDATDTEGINLLIHTFMKSFGTHFVRKIDFGSRLNFQNSLNSLDRYKLEQAGVDMRTGAILSMTSKMGHQLTEEELRQARVFDQLVSIKKSSSSSSYSESGLLNVLNSVPVPLYYEVDRMDRIFEKKMMKTANVNFKRLKELFQTYFLNYCENEKAFDPETFAMCSTDNISQVSAFTVSKENFKAVFTYSGEYAMNPEDATSPANGILWRKKLPEMSAITISWWMKTTPYSSKGSKRRHIASYNSDQVSHFKILAATREEGSCIKLEIDESTVLDSMQCLLPFDGNYHHYVVVWASVYGQWHVYIDGNIVAAGAAASGYFIPEGGYLVIGQDHESGDIAMDSSTVFGGEIAYFNVWDTAMNGVEARNLAESNGNVHGNVLSWDQSDMKFKGEGLDIRAVTSTDEFFRIRGY